MKYIYAILPLFLLALCCGKLPAQELLKSVPVADARLMTTDEMGNVYLVRGDNSLIRYSQDGDSTGNFRSIQNGDLSWIDATNPLRILLFYADFSKIILLDRMLTPKNELDLKTIGIFNAPAVGISVDGRIWVYDFNNARLKKIDDQLNATNTSNDMRIESGTVPEPTCMIEREGKVYLCDAEQGIYTFDRFASFINTLEIKGVSRMQAFGSQLVYRRGDTLNAYDLKSLSLKVIPLPHTADLVDVRIERKRMYFLYANKLDIYVTPDN